MLEEQLIMRSSVLNQPTPLPSFTLAESSSTTTPFKEEPSSSSLDAGELKRKQAHILYNQKHESGHLIEVDLVKSLSLDDFKSLLVWDQSQSWLSFYDFYFKVPLLRLRRIDLLFSTYTLLFPIYPKPGSQHTSLKSPSFIFTQCTQCRY